jgi:formate dehydrogenase iron-sulfur subunit
MTTVYVPRDSAARSVGADEVAAAIAERMPAATVVRTGSRGLLWLEPMVEVQSGEGRVAFGPVDVADVPSLVAALEGGDVHPLRLGAVDDLPWLASQRRLTFARVGVVDPLDPDDFVAHGGLAGLRAAIAMGASAVIESVLASGLRGRGGAGFPAGIKWQTVAAAPGPQKYVCVNADEGDSGTFADRMLLEGDPFSLLEGMAIAGISVGATTGYVYVRSEYPDAVEVLRSTVAIARDRGWLGPDVLGSGHAFDVVVRVGAGSYVCGEETAMLESIEGRRGMVRTKPPVPAVSGLFDRPTLVANVLTVAAVPTILEHGAGAYAALGTGRSTGTQVFQLAGNVRCGGIVETAFGITLRELVEGYGGGTRSGRPVRAVQVGGPLGAYLPASALDVAMDYEALAAAGGMLGHGGIVVFDDTADMAEQARFAMEFCAEESCGKCTPCRIGSVRGVEVIDRIRRGEDPVRDIALLEDLCEVMRDGSLCAMGGLTPMPVLSALHAFGEDFVKDGSAADRGEDDDH